MTDGREEDQVDERWAVAGGDAHKKTVTFAVVDQTGGRVDAASFAIDLEGLAGLVTWLTSLPVRVMRVGIEGSNGWGRHVAASLVAAGFDVREVPGARTAERRRQRRRPKTDREDALAVAREVLAEPQLAPAIAALPRCDARDELAVICQRRRSLIRRRQRLLNEAEAAFNKLPIDVQTAIPARATVAARLRALSDARVTLAPSAVAVREQLDWLCEMAADLAAWDARIKSLETRLPPLLGACGSTLTQEVGIGVVSAAELLAEVGDASRFRSENAFARWCGVAPMAVSSGEADGEPTRHRLDLLGNRTVNRILFTMSVTQARHHEPGQQFLARKRAEGKTKKEARRAHKRQLANRIIRRMWTDQHRQQTRTPDPEALSVAA
jgi:transposase